MAGRILIADDLATNRILLQAKLAAAHYDVLVAPTRASVRELAVTEAPDVILFDLPSADADVLALCRQLKADPATSGIALVALTSRPDAPLRCAALKAGADDVLGRRVAPELLFARLRRLMRARNQEAELALRHETREALGFAEAAPDFEGAGTVVLVAAEVEIARGWRAALAPHLRDRIEVVAHDDLFHDLPGMSTPDVYVIAADLTRPHDGLSLIAELRSRARGRAAGILAVTAPDDCAGMVTALDMGADDVMEHPVDPQELVLRLRAQLRRKARADRMRRQLSDGLRQAMTDPLTGLFNRRYALNRLAGIAEASATSGRPFAVMVLDLDHFKRVNDAFGHAAGDAVLIEVARRIAGGLRAQDFVARLGGEEFIAVMPDTSAEAARSTAERLRRVIEAHPFALPGGGEALALTVSIGVALGGAAAGQASADVLMGVADRALYSAKAEGRNQVTFRQTAA